MLCQSKKIYTSFLIKNLLQTQFFNISNIKIREKLYLSIEYFKNNSYKVYKSINFRDIILKEKNHPIKASLVEIYLIFGHTIMNETLKETNDQVEILNDTQLLYIRFRCNCKLCFFKMENVIEKTLLILIKILVDRYLFKRDKKIQGIQEENAKLKQQLIEKMNENEVLNLIFGKRHEKYEFFKHQRSDITTEIKLLQKEISKFKLQNEENQKDISEKEIQIEYYKNKLKASEREIQEIHREYDQKLKKQKSLEFDFICPI